MLLADLVATSGVVAETPSRSAKTAAIAALLRSTPSDDVAVAVQYLSGATPQKRLGVGWASTWQLQIAAADVATLTLADVDRCFDALAVASGTGSHGERQRLVAQLFAQATSDEQEFLTRLIVGDLRQGAQAGVIADAVAQAAGVAAVAVRRAAMLAGNLAVAAQAALNGGFGALEQIGLRVLNAVQPMLASTSTSVAQAVDELGEVSVEWKLDGIRIQVHRDANQVSIFTRNLNDVTHRFPSVVDAALAMPASSFILDGELIGLHEDNLPQLFQQTAAQFAAGQVALTPFYFDVLHVDGADLIDRPLSARHEALERLVGPAKVPNIVTCDAVAATAFAERAVAAGHEGVVVKAIGSSYEAGRRGKAWRKVKPVITVDLIVIGAEWGHGRRQGWLSNLHLGARDPTGGPPIMVGKTFKGLTDQLLTWQTEHLQRLQERNTQYAVFVKPELVVEIALDGVQISTRYPGGVALRFARVRRYRPDKSALEADTIDIVRALL